MLPVIDEVPYQVDRYEAETAVSGPPSSVTPGRIYQTRQWVDLPGGVPKNNVKPVLRASTHRGIVNVSGYELVAVKRKAEELVVAAGYKPSWRPVEEG